MMHRTATLIALLLAMVAPLGRTQAAPLLEPVWRAQDAQLVLDRLGLSGNDAAQTVGLLLADYEHQWRQAREALAEAVATAPPSEAVPAPALPLIIAFRDRQAALSDRLAADVALVIPDGLDGQWQELRDEVWRRRRLVHGHLAGENVDLWSMLVPIEQDLGLARTEQVQLVLTAWQRRIAELLTQREPYDIEGPTRFRDLVMAGGLESGYRYLADWVAIRQRIRDETLAAATVLTELLPDAAAARLQSDYERAARLYRRPRHEVDDLVQAAMIDQEVDEDTRTELLALHAAWMEAMEELVSERRRIEFSLEPARMLSPMKRRTDRTDKAAELDTARLRNELTIRGSSETHLTQVCTLLGEVICNRLRGTPPRPGPAIQHPSGLPLDDPSPPPLPPGQPFPDKPSDEPGGSGLPPG